MVERSYSKATEAALFAISVKCYYPDCQVPSVSFFGDGEAKNVDIAHIRAISPDGPRYKKTAKAEANSFDNLILLCKLHHRMVDKTSNEETYTEAALLRWKQENEKELRDKVDGLSNLTKDGLNDLLLTAAESTKTEIMGSLDKLHETSKGAAELLRSLYDKIEDHYIDSESIALLDAASQRLSFLEEGSHLLYSASDRLGYLEEGSHIINAASERLGNLEESSITLQQAANQLANININDTAEHLRQSANDYANMLRKSPEIPDIEGSVESAGESIITEIDRRVATIKQLQPPVVVNHEQRWKFGLGGFAAGVLSVFATVAILAYNGAI